MQVHLFVCGLLYKGELNLTHLFGFEGANGSVPWLWDSPLHNGYVLVRSFFQKRRSPLDPVSRRTLIVLCFATSCLLVSFGGGLASSRLNFYHFRLNFFNLDSDLVFLTLNLALSLINLFVELSYKCITSTTTVTFPIFAFSRAFTSALYVLP